jgi:hypothetical protein
MKALLTTLVMAGLTVAGHAQALTGLCSMSSDSNMPWSRWAGVSAAALKQDGAELNAHLMGEAGDMRCFGVAHDGILTGRYEFTANPAFVSAMSSMGFTEMSPSKQQGFLMLDVNTAWVRQMKDAGVTEMTTSKLMGLRALHVDASYVKAMADAGYRELRASKLTEMKAVGVTPEKAREAKALGFQPSEQELIQMSIFKIDRPFVEKMRSKGLTDLTLAKLIKVKIFKVDE